MLGKMTAKTVWFMTKRWKTFPMRRRMLGWVKRAGHTGLGGSPVRVKMSAETVMEVDPADEHGWALLVDRALEPRVADAFKAILRKGDTVLDVGANHGYFTLLASSLVGHGGHVYSFEPDPPVAKLLFENVRLNNCANVKLHHAAVSNAAGTTRFNVPAPRPGAPPVAVEVPVIVIDAIAEEMPKARLVKIDVAGAELLALEGMRELLGYDRPFVILDATDARIRKVHGDASQVFTLFRSLGYSTYEIGPHGARAIDRPTHESILLLAVPPGAHPPDLTPGHLPLSGGGPGRG